MSKPGYGQAMGGILPILLLVGTVIVLSAVSFVLYGVDKSRARRGGRRIPEGTLLTVDLLGGWPGGSLGRRTFRHKTAKLSYRLAWYACALVHASVVAGVVWVTLRS